jgi:hypothetical protein
MEGPSVILFRGGETHSRSVTKAISWRALGTIDTFAISWFMTGRVEIAGSIAGVEIITKIAWLLSARADLDGRPLGAARHAVTRYPWASSGPMTSETAN